MTEYDSDEGKDEAVRWVVAEDRAAYYDLEERTFVFAKEVRVFIKKIELTLANVEDAKQLVRSSGSVGANYIEANEAVSRKDFVYRIKLSRKETKESRLWLRLLDLQPTPNLEQKRDRLIQEALELTRIFGAIYHKSKTQS